MAMLLNIGGRITLRKVQQSSGFYANPVLLLHWNRLVILCEASGTSSFISVFSILMDVPPPIATEEQIRVYKEVTEPSVLRKRASIKGKIVREAQKTFRITHADQFDEHGTYLRVYVHPINLSLKIYKIVYFVSSCVRNRNDNKLGRT
ncbi:hypothetical protein V8G54_016735 [Vigna mungo]|uniref:Uncharacterized protein n=1 Tax=Vigna mungo TaxID=3915 RepID=A0AAQ3NNK6_VIGMU